MIATGKLVFRCLLLGLTVLLAFDHARSQDQPEQSQPTQPAGGMIHGIVKSGLMPIPGAAVSISLASSNQKISVWTEQSIGIVADQGMTAGWKEDGPAVGHAGGNILRPAGRAEPIVFGADCQDRAGDLLDRIRLMRSGSLNVEVHPCDALSYRQKVVQNLLHSRLLAGLGARLEH